VYLEIPSNRPVLATASCASGQRSTTLARTRGGDGSARPVGPQHAPSQLHDSSTSANGSLAERWEPRGQQATTLASPGKRGLPERAFSWKAQRRWRERGADICRGLRERDTSSPLRKGPCCGFARCAGASSRSSATSARGRGRARRPNRPPAPSLRRVPSPDAARFASRRDFLDGLLSCSP